MSRKLLLLVIILGFVQPAVSQSVGIAPGVLNLSEIERGESRTIELYITSSGTDEPFELKASYKEPMGSNIFGPDTAVDAEEYSEESISSWISFSEDSYTIDPSSSQTYQTAGGAIVADGTIEMEISVPRNAEPGYHAGQVKLNPQFGGEDSGFGTSILTLSRSQFFFRVPGNAERDISYQGVEAVRTGENEVQLVAQFRNTGTVTVEFTGGELTVYDQRNRKAGQPSFGSVSIPPDETRRLESRIGVSSDAAGTYSMDGTLSYRTGEVYVGDEFTFTGAPREPIQVEEPSEQGSGSLQEAEPPLLLIVVVLGMLATMMYYFGVKLFWIVTGVGLTAITIFIMTTGTPVYVLLIALMGAGLLIYMEW